MGRIVGVTVKGFVVYDSKVLILQRNFQDSYEPGTWELAGGKMEFGETLESAVLREIVEECSLNVKLKELIYADTFFLDKERQVVLIAYKLETDDDLVVLSDEHTDYKWVDEIELRQKLPKAIVSSLEKKKVFEKVFS